MGTVQQNALSAEIWQNINNISANEPLMMRLARYVRKLVKEQNDALFTKEEYLKRIKEAENGPSYELKEGETLEDLLERIS